MRNSPLLLQGELKTVGRGEEMNTRVRIVENGMKEIPKLDKIEEKMMVVDRRQISYSRRERKIALEQDVDKLRKKLRHEENVHRALERAFTRPLGALPRLPSYLPPYTLELLAEIAVLEEEVVRLEEQVMNFRQGLYQEAILYISSYRKRKEIGLDSKVDRFLSSRSKNSEQTDSFHPPMRWSNANPSSSNRFMNGKHLPNKLIFSSDENHIGKENQSNKLSTMNIEHSSVKNDSRILDSQAFEESGGANKLSEEILRCLLCIFARISLPKNKFFTGSEMHPSVSGSRDDLYEDIGFWDPYDICEQFGRRDIGPYKHLSEVDVSSSDLNLMSEFWFQTRRLKSLLKKLASVDVSELTHTQKLAFWVNIYNSCMMKEFLQNDLPTSPEMVVQLMLKANVNVGGHLLSAMTIEHFMLRLPYTSKHILPKGLKSNEVTRSSMLGLDWPEPLVTFALSCGSWSSPAVRIYTACQVERQLEEAKRDYLQAAIGFSKSNRLAIPKLLDWYMLDFAKDMESLMDWICLQLPNEIRKDVVKCLEVHRKCGISLPIQVLPYEFRFRYLLTA